MTTKTATAAALEAAQTKLDNAQQTAAQYRANLAQAQATIEDHRNQAAVYGDKAKAARADFANAVRNNVGDAARATLRECILDNESLSEHHAAEADRVTQTLPELERLADGSMRATGQAEIELSQAEFNDALAVYRDQILPSILPAVSRLHKAIQRTGGSLAIDYAGSVGPNWTALPEFAPGFLNGERLHLTA